MAQQIKVKSPFFAFILSSIIPGLGQLYNGSTGLGLFFLFLAAVSFVLFFIIIGYFLYPLVCILAAITAYTGAKKANRLFMTQIQQIQGVKPQKLD